MFGTGQTTVSEVIFHIPPATLQAWYGGIQKGLVGTGKLSVFALKGLNIVCCQTKEKQTKRLLTLISHCSQLISCENKKQNTQQFRLLPSIDTSFMSVHLRIRAGYCGPKNVLRYIAISKKVLQYIAIFINLIWKCFLGTFDGKSLPNIVLLAIERQSNRSRHQNNYNSLEIHTFRSG